MSTPQRQQINNLLPGDLTAWLEQQNIDLCTDGDDDLKYLMSVITVLLGRQNSILQAVDAMQKGHNTLTARLEQHMQPLKVEQANKGVA